MESTETPAETGHEADSETPTPVAPETSATPAAKPKRLNWINKTVLALIVLVPAWFMIAALGTRAGLWDYGFGLGTLIIGLGVWVLGIAALIALVALIIAWRRKPRSKFGTTIAVVGLLVPLAFLAWFASLAGKAGSNPIHDVATDTADPPTFSAGTMRAREQAGANPLNDYQTPLGRIEPWASSDRIEEDVKNRSHAQIITTEYAGLAPLPLGGASRADAIQSVAAAMEEMGLELIRKDEEAGLVEGVAKSFWFGFEDDVVARVGEQEIDFRSVSRVGVSDLGVNAARIEELRQRTAMQIGQR